MTAEHNEDCKQLLRLMGVPVIDAPSEAEAQCAAMASAGVVYGAATEDMDCLTFGCPRLIRHLMASQVVRQNVRRNHMLSITLQELYPLAHWHLTCVTQTWCQTRSTVPAAYC